MREVLTLPPKARPQWDSLDNVTDAEKLKAFLVAQRYTLKHQVAADKRLISAHQTARGMIAVMTEAEPTDSVRAVLAEVSGLPMYSSVRELVINAIFEYSPKDKPAKSRDVGVQLFLEKCSIAEADVPDFIMERGGVLATYRSWCAERRGEKADKSGARVTFKKSLAEISPDGGLMLALMRLDEKCRPTLVRGCPLPIETPVDGCWERVIAAATGGVF